MQNNSLESLHNNQAQLALYRVVQELINNIIKYSEATEVAITESYIGENYTLSITDNGNSFEPSENDLIKSGSLGLKNRRSRIQQFGGTIVNIEI